MDGFELNKIIAAILLALLIGMVSSKVADIMIEPQKLAKNVFVVEGLEIAEHKGVDVTATGPEPIEPLLAKADVKRGEVVAKKCLQCHTFEKGGPNKIGPNLYGVVGHKIAAIAGFAYSKAFVELKGDWDFKKLNELLYRPSEFARGTKMSFAGLQKGQERADVIAYLNSLSDSPNPLPKASEVVESKETKSEASGKKDKEDGKDKVDNVVSGEDKNKLDESKDMGAKESEKNAPAQDATGNKPAEEEKANKG